MPVPDNVSVTHPGLERAEIGISSRAERIARQIDRLPPGEYIIRLSKGSPRDTNWTQAVFERAERVHQLSLGR